jgi:hypothetical protein
MPWTLGLTLAGKADTRSLEIFSWRHVVDEKNSVFLQAEVDPQASP